MSINIDIVVEALKQATNGLGVIERFFGKGVVTGLVLDREQCPVTDVKVLLIDRKGKENFDITAQNGKFLLPGLKGAYDISIIFQGQNFLNVEKVFISAHEKIAITIHLPISSKIMVEEQKTSKFSTVHLNTSYELEHNHYPIRKETACRGVVRATVPGHFSTEELHLPTHLCFILDVSGSMNVPDKYPYLLESVRILLSHIQKQQWISLIVFSNQATTVAALIDADAAKRESNYIIQKIDQFEGKFGGTYLSSGLELAVNLLDAGKKRGLTQRLYAITDGQLQDKQESLGRLSEKLRTMQIEFMSYGLGADFALETIKPVMLGCYGGGVKHISDKETLREIFAYLGRIGSKIVAKNLNVSFHYAPKIIGGDAFLFRPVREHYPLPPKGNISVPVGMVEIDRIYQLAFECRIPSFVEDKITIGEVWFDYEMEDGKHHDILLLEAYLQNGIGAARPEITEIWTDLEDLRKNDMATIKASLNARINISIREHRPQDYIDTLKATLASVVKTGGLKDLSEEQKKVRAIIGPTLIPIRSATLIGIRSDRTTNT